jgi:hypothetical protein
MITLSEIWNILVMKMPKGWTPLQEVYSIVQRNHKLDDDDFNSESPRSNLPKWQRNVRNVLQYRRGTGEIEWDRNGNYRLALIRTQVGKVRATGF